jgi:hypothetical protein
MALINGSNGIPLTTNPPKAEPAPAAVKPVKVAVEPVDYVEPAPTVPKQTKKTQKAGR